MPVYSYKCSKCNTVTDEFRHINQRDNSPSCCGVVERVILPAMVQPILGGGDIPGYQCVVSGEYVTSRKRRREIMREYNVEERG